jgi:AcrR family transcriptional regulator
MSTESKTRPYRKRRRAEQEQETRLRITEAIMNLHEEVGPARTTVSAIADKAGVQRATVYRHFPDVEAQVAACSAHWLSLHPPPDPSPWMEIADPDERLRTALKELYGWYEATAPTVLKLYRDAPLVPPIQTRMEARAVAMEATAELLLNGRGLRGARKRRVHAAIAHALAFGTWGSLVGEQGLGADEAVELMAGLVAAA